MNPIEYALRQIFTRIPRELLENAFQASHTFGYIDNRTVEERIREQVIEQFVKPDIDLTGGQQVLIRLDNLSPKSLENGVLYEVPLSYTQGRKITSVMTVEYGTGNGSSDYGSTRMESLISQSLRANLGMSGGSSTGARLVGPNMVFIENTISIGNTNLRCYIANDENMANLNRGGIIAFGNLCLMACKGIVYNTLRVSMGEASVIGGSLNSRLNEILDSYSDSFQLYDEFRDTTWRKIQMFSDDLTRTELTRMSLPRH